MYRAFLWSSSGVHPAIMPRAFCMLSTMSLLWGRRASREASMGVCAPSSSSAGGQTHSARAETRDMAAMRSEKSSLKSSPLKLSLRMLRMRERESMMAMWLGEHSHRMPSSASLVTSGSSDSAAPTTSRSCSLVHSTEDAADELSLRLIHMSVRPFPGAMQSQSTPRTAAILVSLSTLRVREHIVLISPESINTFLRWCESHLASCATLSVAARMVRTFAGCTIVSGWTFALVRFTRRWTAPGMAKKASLLASFVRRLDRDLTALHRTLASELWLSPKSSTTAPARPKLSLFSSPFVESTMSASVVSLWSSEEALSTPGRRGRKSP
mmetsp:Transcript_7318/g.18704  ORF Transcript_7318/g.18704 Transcript_7318/m.18704 type:complete len:326 (-) Transcript_7318:143-1120(-)